MAVQTVMGCLAPENDWADRRARTRVVGLIILLIFFGWLIETQDLTLIESIGAFTLIGIVTGAVLSWVVDGGFAALTTLLRIYSSITPASPAVPGRIGPAGPILPLPARGA